MADARQHKFSVVLVAAFDRVARSTRHFLQVIDELEEAELLIAPEEVPDGFGEAGGGAQRHGGESDPWVFLHPGTAPLDSGGIGGV